MGFCFSCCRRRPKDRGEREPLLPKSTDDVLPPPQSHLDKVADVLAAISAGKLPTQSQLNHALQALLMSDLLDARAAAHVIGYKPLSTAGQKVVEDAREVVEAALELGMQRNSDDTLQDMAFQIREISGPPVEADIAVHAENSGPSKDSLNTIVDALPSTDEVTSDAVTVIGSLQNLAGLVLTSSTFRILLADALSTIRSVVADAAAEVGHVAAQVQGVAQTVEEVTRPGGEPIEQLQARAAQATEEVGAAGEATKERWERLARESPDRVRQRVIGRVQNILVRAQETPTYRSALLTLLFIARKYIARLSAISQSMSAMATTSSENPHETLEPVVWTEPHLVRALTDLRTLIERSASGHSLGPLLALLQRTLMDVLSTPGTVETDTRALFADAAGWLHTALTRDGYVGSQEATRDAEQLYDRAHVLLTAKNAEGQPASPVARDAHALFTQVDALLTALSSDKPTHRFLTALDALSADIQFFTARAALIGPRVGARAAARWRAELIRDAVGWLVPRLLRAAGALPMPRVEYASAQLDAALDALLLTAPRQRGRAFNASASLLPDHLSVQNWSEVRLDVVRTSEGGEVLASPLAGGSGIPRGVGGVSTATRVRVAMDGLRVSAHDVGYYVNYRLNQWIGYEDEGLVSLDIGREDRAGEGVRVVLELEFDTSTDSEPEERANGNTYKQPQPLFRVLDVQADVPGLRFALDRSKHWIINKLLLQPLVAPVGRALVRLLVANQIKGILEHLSQSLGEAKQEVDALADKRGAETQWTDWWVALSKHFGGGNKLPNEHGDADGTDEEGEEEPRAPHVESRITPTAKGIVRTTVTQPDPDIPSPPPPETSKLAVGVGAQILPGKGGPHDAHGTVETERPVDVAREALSEVQEEVDDAEARVEEAVEEAVRVREQLDQAGTRGTVRARVEQKREGWRSRAFDVW